MPRPRSGHPTELELAILKVLWKGAPLVVDEVRRRLADSGRELSYSSVITVMNIMVGKHYLERHKRGKAFAYRPLIEERDVNRGILHDVIDRVYDGSAKAVMLELLETSDVDREELEEIRRMIRRKAREIES